jgi:hypothetical protein
MVMNDLAIGICAGYQNSHPKWTRNNERPMVEFSFFPDESAGA